MKYEQLCKDILAAVGGKENVDSAFHCITRLRLTLKDESKMDISKLEAVPGVLKVNKFQTQIQVIIGDHVREVYPEFCELAGVAVQGEVAADDEDDDVTPKAKMSPLAKLTEAMTGIMMPLLPAMVGFGLTKGLAMLLSLIKVLDASSPTYTFLYQLGDASIYMMPIMAAWSSAKYFKVNEGVALILVASTFVPKMQALLATEGGAKVFGFIPLGNQSYASTVIPAILIVWVYSIFAKLNKKYFPKAIQGNIGQMCAVILSGILTYAVVGPIGAFVGKLLATAYSAIYNVFPPLAGAVVGGLWCLLVSWGMHTALVPIVVNNLAVFGFDTLMAFASCGNFGQFGALLATILKTKDNDTKLNATSLLAVTAAGGFGGTEPVIYGNNMPLGTPFIAGLIGGAVGGVISAIMNVHALSVGAFSFFKIGLYAESLPGVFISCFVSAVVGFVITYIRGFKEVQVKKVL